jgi:hypothetical protein
MKENDEWRKNKNKRKITAKELLFAMVDVPVNALLSFDDKYPFTIPHYDEKFSCENFAQKIYYLKEKKLIKTIVKDNEKFYEITQKGREKIAWDKIDEVTKRKTGNWDGYLRIVMFDVPEAKKSTREVVRKKLESIGFIQEQKSVFIYPFECKEEIDAISYFCSSSTYLKYLVVQIIEGQEEIIKKFVDRGILTKADLKSARTHNK